MGPGSWHGDPVVAAGIGRELFKKEFLDKRDYAAVTRRAAEEFRFAFPQNLELSTLIGTLSSPRWSELILVT